MLLVGGGNPEVAGRPRGLSGLAGSLNRIKYIYDPWRVPLKELEYSDILVLLVRCEYKRGKTAGNPQCPCR